VLLGVHRVDGQVDPAARGIEQLIGMVEIGVGIFGGEGLLFTCTAIPVAQAGCGSRSALQTNRGYALT
jgi:hypothetical protein